MADVPERFHAAMWKMRAGHVPEHGRPEDVAVSFLPGDGPAPLVHHLRTGGGPVVDGDTEALVGGPSQERA